MAYPCIGHSVIIRMCEYLVDYHNNLSALIVYFMACTTFIEVLYVVPKH